MNKILHFNLTKQVRLLAAFSLFFMLGFTANAQVTATVDATNPTCGGFTNGSITANGSGGWDPYTYQWSTGETTQSIFGLGPGTYTVTVTDMDLGFDVATATLTSAPQTDADIVIDDICSGNGNVTVPTTGGVAPYTYNWSDGGSGDTRTGLLTGTQYCVTVLDANVCGVVTCVVIPEAIGLTVTGSTVACSDACDGSVTTNISGGTAPYDVLWDNGVTSEVNANLTAGTYFVTVTDANGCTASGSGTIGAPSAIDLTVSVTSPPCGDNTMGAASVNPSGGTPNYSYIWSNGASTQSISGLSAGTYSVTVTDSQGCQASTDVVVSPSSQVDIAINSNNPTCAAPNGGSATATASNGVAPYTYAWNTGATTQTITNLGAGMYTVIVTDATDCSNVASVTLTQEGASIFATVTQVNASCGEANGTATAQGSGGSGNYSYSWSNGANTQTITGLVPGTYTVTVTDNNSGCVGAKTIFVTGTDGVDVFVTTMNAICNANNGNAMASPSNGTAPYTYAWSNGGNTQVILGLAAGSYTVTVTDANGCTAVDSAIVNETGSTVNVTAMATTVDCFGGNNGAVGTSASGGTTPYSFAWSNGANTVTISNLTAGTYNVTVTDANGCSSTASATVIQPSQLNINASNTPAACAGGNTGSATVNANGGTAPYTYTWSNGGNTPTISNLSAGTYTVTVSDSNGCTETATTTVTQGDAITLSLSNTAVSCFGGNNGTASVNAFGGTTPYIYAWSNGGNTETITGLSAGTYTVTVTDANDCTSTSSTTVTQGNDLDIATNSTAVSCPGGINGTVSAAAAGGSSPYTYAWSNGGNTSTITDLTNGTYTVTVTDANGCSGVSTATVAISNSPSLSCSVTITSPVSENDGNDGALTVNVSNGSGNYSYTWSNGANTQSISSLSPGTYTVTVTDNTTGCTTTCANTLANPPDCVCDNFTDPGQICCDQTACGTGYDPAPITSLVSPSGGSGGPIEYIWMFKEGQGPFNQTQVTEIPNTNTLSYDPPALYVTTTYYRCARRGPCCPFIETTGITIFINEDADASFSGPADNILCQGETYTYTANTSSSTATYSWNVQGSAVVTGENTSSIEVVWSSNGFYDVMLTVTDNACTASTVDNRLVTNSSDYCGNLQGGGGAQGLVIDATVIHSKNVEVELLTQEGSTAGVVYVLERSKDGIDFDEVSTVVMNNLTYNQQNDLDPMRGRSFYRVSMTNEAGIVSYSNTEQITIFIGNENTLIYPNPFRGEINYEILDTFGEEVTLEVIAADGRIVRTFVSDKDTFQVTLDTNDLPSGMYFMRFNFSSLGVQTVKMMKQ